MGKCAALLALLSLAALVVAEEHHGWSDVIYDADDDMDLPQPLAVQAGRERRQVMRPASSMGAPFLHATCRLQPAPGSSVQGLLYLFQKRWRWDYVKVKGSLWGMTEPKERFEVVFHEDQPMSPGACEATGDTLFGATGYEGYLGQVKAKGYGRATGFSRGSRAVTLEPDQENSVSERSIVVTSLSSKKRVACCAIQAL